MDDVVDLVRDLVAQGWYIDEFESKPDPADPLRPPLRPDGTVDLPAYAQWQRRRTPRVSYQRGTEQFRVAWEQGLVELPPPLTVATERQVSRTEKVLGFPLPPVLRRLYLEVGNGGFGPLWGIPGAEGGFRTDEGDLLYMNRYNYLQGTEDDPVEGDFPQLMWFFNWGHTAWSGIDCRTPEGQMYLLEDMELEPAGMTLEEWFRRWIDHRIEKGLPA